MVTLICGWFKFKSGHLRSWNDPRYQFDGGNRCRVSVWLKNISSSYSNIITKVKTSRCSSSISVKATVYV